MRTKQHQEQDALVERAAFKPLPDQVRPARDWARETYCRIGGKESDAETVALLVSELVTNAVRYADGGLIEVTVWASLDVDVRDTSAKRPERQSADDDAENGRGLFLVTALSSSYTVIPTEDGKISRFSLVAG